MRYFKLLFILLVTSQGCQCFAQHRNYAIGSVDGYVLYGKKETIGLNFKMPQGFSIKSAAEPTLILPAFLSTILDIVNSNQDVLVGFYIFDTRPAGRERPYNENNYKRLVNGLIDTVRHELPYGYGDTARLNRPMSLDSAKIVFLDSKNYNANTAFEFDVPLSRPYLKKYGLCRAFFMYKKDHGEVFAFYFYNLGVPIEDYMKKNADMLTFDK